MYLPHAQFQHFSAARRRAPMPWSCAPDGAARAGAGGCGPPSTRLDPEVPVAQVRTHGRGGGAARSPTAAATWPLLGAFAVLALALSRGRALRLCATTSRSARAEIGVRMALGAARGQVARLILGQSLRMVQAGLRARASRWRCWPGPLRGHALRRGPARRRASWPRAAWRCCPGDARLRERLLRARSRGGRGESATAPAGHRCRRR
jgi:hypothetical protein